MLFFRGYSQLDYVTLSTGIWKTDGTPSGTIEVKSLYTGGQPSMVPTPLKAVGDNLFFVGNTSNLWFSDGTNSGTRELTNARIDPQLPWTASYSTWVGMAEMMSSCGVATALSPAPRASRISTPLGRRNYRLLCPSAARCSSPPTPARDSRSGRVTGLKQGRSWSKIP